MNRIALRIAFPALAAVSCVAPGVVFVEPVVAQQSQWILVGGAAQPPLRTDHALAYDAARQEVVLFGGWAGGGPWLGDTWAWNGVAWTQRSPAFSPIARSGHALAYDSGRQRIVLFGGSAANSGASAYLGDTYEWDGVNWLPRPTVTFPARRRNAGMAYDAVRQRTVLFGGELVGGTLSNETWEWDGNNWAPRPSLAFPSARQRASMAYDAVRNRTVLVGGELVGGALSSETWEWSGLNWFPAASAAEVGIPVHAATETGRSRGFHFLAQTSFFLIGLDLPPEAKMPGDTASYLVRVNGNTVLRSVGNGGPIALGISINVGDAVDVIGNWSPAGAGSTTARNSVGTAVAGGGAAPFETVIEGVAHTLNRCGWQWDIGDPTWVDWGATGSYLAPGPGPIGRVRMHTSKTQTAAPLQIAWMPATPFGPRIAGLADGAANANIMRAFDGGSWSSWFPTGVSLFGFKIAHDGARNQLLAFGQTSGAATAVLGGTPSAATTVGVGCGSPVLQCTPQSGSSPILGAIARARISNAPTPLIAVTAGFSTATIGQFPLPLPLDGFGMSGCVLRHSADILGLPVAPVAGGYEYALPIPSQMALLGLHVYVQAYGYAPSQNLAEIVVSNRLDWRIGDM